jgi:hypothetical protein
MSEQPSKYVFGVDEQTRIYAAEELFDEGTKRRVKAFGIGPRALPRSRRGWWFDRSLAVRDGG